MNLLLASTIVTVSLTVSFSVFGQTSKSPPSELTTLQGRLTAARKNATHKLTTDYLRNLGVLQKSMQDSGSLDGAIAVENEIKSVTDIGDTTSGESNIPELVKLRTTYKESIQVALAPIQSRYVEELEKLQAALVKRGELNAALLVRDELNGAKSTVLTDVFQGGAPSRPADAVEHSGKYYKLFEKILSWHDARDECVSMGGHLACVENTKDNQFILDLVRGGRREGYWLGATDEETEGTWLWVNSSKMKYTNWGGSQPNNKELSEHYLVLVTRFNGNANVEGKWADQPKVSEVHKPGFICEWDAK